MPDTQPRSGEILATASAQMRESDDFAQADGALLPRADRTALAVTALNAWVLDDRDRVRWLDPETPDLSLLASGAAPVLVQHRGHVDDLVGVVTSAWIEDGNLLTILRFGTTPRAETMWQLVRDDVLRHTSIGFFCEYAPDPDTPGALRAKHWRPYEISLCAVPRSWEARIAVAPVPQRIMQAAAERAAQGACGSPNTWRAWAAAAAPTVAEIGLSEAVEAELTRLRADAAARFA